jgi:hypothetical protein
MINDAKFDILNLISLYCMSSGVKYQEVQIAGNHI